MSVVVEVFSENPSLKIFFVIFVIFGAFMMVRPSVFFELDDLDGRGPYRSVLMKAS